MNPLWTALWTMSKGEISALKPSRNQSRSSFCVFFGLLPLPASFRSLELFGSDTIVIHRPRPHPRLHNKHTIMDNSSLLNDSQKTIPYYSNIQKLSKHFKAGSIYIALAQRQILKITTIVTNKTERPTNSKMSIMPLDPLTQFITPPPLIDNLCQWWLMLWYFWTWVFYVHTYVDALV